MCVMSRVLSSSITHPSTMLQKHFLSPSTLSFLASFFSHLHLSSTPAITPSSSFSLAFEGPRWRLADLHRNVCVQRILLDLNQFVGQGADAVLLHCVLCVLYFVEPLWVGLVVFVSLVLNHSVAADADVWSGHLHPIQSDPVVNVVVLPSPAPVLVWEAIDLQKLFFAEA